MTCLGVLPQWLLRMAEPEPVRSPAGGSGAAGPDCGHPQPVSGHLRCAPCPRRAGRRGCGSVGRKRVARLMRQAHIQGVHRRRKVTTTRRNPKRTAAPDLVKREFTADGPDRTWMADITYIPTKAGFLYLAVVIDVWSRRVVGWSMRDDMATPLVTDAPDHGHRTAQTREGDPPLRCGGSQYTSAGVQSPLPPGRYRNVDGTPRRRIRQRRSRIVLRHPRNRTPGPCQGPERLRHPEPGPIRRLRPHFEGFYNPHRRHSTIGYHSPTDYERNPQLPCR